MIKKAENLYLKKTVQEIITLYVAKPEEEFIQLAKKSSSHPSLITSLFSSLIT